MTLNARVRQSEALYRAATRIICREKGAPRMSSQQYEDDLIIAERKLDGVEEVVSLSLKDHPTDTLIFREREGVLDTYEPRRKVTDHLLRLVSGGPENA